MNRSDLWQRAEEIFHAALAREGDERFALLEPYRAADPDLFAMVRDMLAESSLDVASDDDSIVGRDGAPEEDRLPDVIGPYRIVREIGRGGMGIVFEARQARLNRPVALKILRSLRSGSDSRDPVSKSRFLREARRFVDEAQVLGLLDHPGIVPILELGETEAGIAYFTMRLVGGDDLRAVLEKVRTGAGDWNLTRALGLIQRVCDTLAFAHHRGVIHRDVKPSNVMVGSFGEVYVIDWGLARVIGRSDAAAMRAPDSARAAPQVDPSRTFDTLDTLEGDVIGTPSYMSPEQAAGRLEHMGARSDVYSVGAILYELLASHPPHWDPSGANDSLAVLARVRKGSPPSLATRPSIPPMLAAICDRAMARESADRYPSAEALGEDLSAYLTHRVVHAYRTGPLAELSMWCVRNRALAATLAASALFAIVAIVGLSVLVREYARERADVFTLSATRDHAALVADADALWPADRAHATALADWIRRAEDLIGELPAYRDRRDALRARALPITESERLRDRESHPEYASMVEIAALADAIPERIERATKMLEEPIDGAGAPARRERIRAGLAHYPNVLARLRGQLADIESRVSERRTFQFANREDAWWHDQLDRLVRDLEGLVDPATGMLDGLSPQHGLGVRRRLDLALRIAEQTVEGSPARTSWNEAIARIADPTTCPAYRGLVITPQLGLLPLGVDPESGLYEFWHPESGEPPRRGPNGRWHVDGETSLVFVLVPTGRFRMGAQSIDPLQPNFDPDARFDEAPDHEVDVGAYFLSKYEMTVGQWRRFTGADPGSTRNYFDGRTLRDDRFPIENIGFESARETLRRMALSLPTEEEWEYACRAGSTTPYWWGTRDAEFSACANYADVHYGAERASEKTWFDADADDGFAIHAPVGSFPPNRFGIHECLGNVLEWCRNRWTPMYLMDQNLANPANVARGGSYASSRDELRCADRVSSDVVDQAGLGRFGVRPCRALVPTKKEDSR